MLLLAGAVVGPQMMASLLIGGTRIDQSISNSNLNIPAKTSGTIGWDAATKTLSFKDVVLTGYEGNVVYFDGNNITFRFEGKNVIKCTNHCFVITVSSFCRFTTKALSPTAYLEMESGHENNKTFTNIDMMDGSGDLDIENIYLKGTTYQAPIIGANSSNKLHFKTVWAHFNTTASYYSAIEGFSSCEISNGSYVEEGKYDTSKKAFVNGSANMGEVKILPELTVGGYIVDASQKGGGEYGPLAIIPKGLTGGSISYDGDIHFEGVSGAIGDKNLPENYGNTLVLNNNVDGLRVLVEGENTITPASGVSTSYGLITKNDKSLSIMGYTADYQSDKLTFTGDSCVISEGPLEFYCVTATLTGKFPVWAMWGLNIHQSKVTATVPNPVQSSQAIAAINATLEDCDVANGYLDKYGFFGRDNKELTTVKIDVPSLNYPVTVLGRKLNDVNIREFAAPGFKAGTLSYDIPAYTLNMKDVDIDIDWGDYIGIEAHCPGICFEGNNTILVANRQALVAYTDVTVSTKDASGNTVVFGSYKNAGCFIRANNTLTLKGNSITFAGYQGGLIGSNNSTLKLLKTSSGKGQYVFASADLTKDGEPTPNPAFTVGTLINEDGLGFDFNASLGAYDAAYWDADKKRPIKNGGDFAQMVNLQPVTKKYGLFVAGVQVNDINRYGMASKAFTKEGSAQVYYNPSTGVLTLDNAYIDMKAAGVAANAIELNRYDFGEPSHSLSLRGESYIQTYNNYHGLYTLSDAVISSATQDFKSSLEIHSNGGDGKAIYPENLTIKDRAYVKLTGLKGSGIGNTEFPDRANLTVDDATLDVEMYGIQKIKSLTLQGGSSITYPEGGRFDSSKQAVVDADGNTAMKVQIHSVNDNVTSLTDQLPIDEANFPESKFRKFVSENFDTNGNGYLSKAEIEAIQMINITFMAFGIGSEGLKGIEHFWNLKQLICNSCIMEWPDLSKNTNLEYLEASYNLFYGNMDLSKNTKLYYLDVSSSYVTILDLSANTALEELHCSGNRLTALDLTTNTKLKYLDIHQNKIRVEAMEALVNSLPTTQPSMLDNFIACQNEADDGNQITKAQADIARAKNWNVSTDKYTEELKKGDVNGDGVVDVADIGAIIDVMAGSASGSLADKADVNGDDSVDVADIGAVIDIMAGKGDDQSGTDKAPKNAEAVDLGLPSGTKWANMNVGALYPWGYGLFFAWGETKGYTSVPEGTPDDKGKYTMTDHSFDWASYKWCNGTKDSMTKYCTNSEYGTEDGMLNLLPEDDAAQANWGGQWVMPTYDEMKELVDNTTCTETTVNGVKGWEYTSDINGKSIFLPAAGYRDGDWLGYQSEYGAYWTATADATRSYTAKGLLKADILQMVAATIRNCGYCVRPVIRKK